MKLVNEFRADEKEFYQLRFNLDTNEAILELIYDINNHKTVYPKIIVELLDIGKSQLV